MQIQVNQPVTLTNQDGEQATFGKGVQTVPAKFCSGWYFDALKADDTILVLKEDDEEEAKPFVDLLDGNVKNIVAAIEAADMSIEELVALAKRESEGKARKGVLDAIVAKQAV